MTVQIVMVSEKDFVTGKTKQILEPLSLTMGYFDGLHRGHQALFDKTLELAREKQSKSAVLTFTSAPKVATRIDQTHLLTPAETETKLTDAGFDYYIIVEFGADLMQMTPEQYLQQLTTLFDVQTITVGTDFRFGTKRSGTIDTLATYVPTFAYELHALKLVAVEGEGSKISSSEIRNLITNGEITKANDLLGYPFSVSGIVITGEQKGRKIGFPTANMLIPQDKVIPANGVYVVEVIVNGKTYGGMTNIGLAPTLKQITEQVIETNIFDFDQDIYGETITVRFYERIRPEKKFAGIHLLIEQLEKDVAFSKKHLHDVKL